MTHTPAPPPSTAKRGTMKDYRITIAVFALIGALVGAAAGFFLVPHASRYTASANVALLPASDLTLVEASAFWEVLTRGQVTRTAAVVYGDERWLIQAANTAKVPQSQLTLTAAALPETTILTVKVTAGSAATAETALSDVLNSATPQVSALAVPYTVKVLWPTKGSATEAPSPGRLQFAAAGALGGLLVGAGAGWFSTRRSRAGATPLRDGSGGPADEDAFARS